MANDYMAKLAADLDGMTMGGLASKGRYGDTMIAHINPQEAQMLMEEGGSGTINPVTGLPEFYDMGFGSYSDAEESAAADAAEAAADQAMADAADAAEDQEFGETFTAIQDAARIAEYDQEDQEFGDTFRGFSDEGLGGPDVEDDLTLEAFSLQARVQDQVADYNKNGFPTPEEQYLYTQFKNQGMTNQEATVATAQSVSTPGGRQAMEDGFYGGYSYGGMLGTVQNAIQEYNDAFNARAQAFAKKKGEERDKQDAEIDDFTGIPDTEEEPGFFDNLIDSLNLDSLNPFSRDEERDQDLAQAYAEYGGSFTPTTDTEKMVGFGLGMFGPGIGASNLIGGLTGSNVLGTITTPTGATLNLTESGNVYDAFMPDAPDSGNEPAITKKRKEATKKTDDEEDKEEEVDKPYFPRNLLPFTPSEEQTITNIYGPDSYLLNQTGLRTLV
jgi:hypothetical protein